MKTPPREFHPEPFAYHEETIVKISSLTNEGTGVGRINDWVVMIPYALPGEKIRARIWRNHKNYSVPKSIQLLLLSLTVLPSPPRRIPSPAGGLPEEARGLA